MHFIHDRIADCIFSYARDCINPTLGYPFDHSSILSENLPLPDSSMVKLVVLTAEMLTEDYKYWTKTTNSLTVGNHQFSWKKGKVQC